MRNAIISQILPAIRWPLLCVCWLLVSSSFGCQFTPKAPMWRWPWKKDASKVVPERVLPVWTDSILHQPNQPGVRGFGGRMYFYQKDDTDPIEVDGGMAIYVFDADDFEPGSQTPLRKFVFTADQFATHMSHTTLGPSYSVWLPWGEVGGPPKRLSLIARFEGRQGGTAISDPTIKLLPGVPEKEIISEQAVAEGDQAASSIRLAGHVQKTSDADEASSSDRERGIQTIDLPPSFQRHLRSDEEASEERAGDEPSAEVAAPTGRDDNLLSEVPTQLEASPITTEVFDHRTRKQQGSKRGVFGPPLQTNIRKGRWIESISRRQQP